MKKIILLTLIFFTQFLFSKNSTPVKSTAPAVLTSSEKTLSFTPEDGTLNFSATGRPAMIKILGHAKGPAGKITIAENIVNGSFEFDLNSLETGIEMRDDHMKNKYLEVGKFPKAALNIKDVKVSKLDESTTEFNANVEMTLHGKTKPIVATIKVHKDGALVVVEAEFILKIMDYLDTLPSYAGIKVAEDVKINLQTKAKIN